MLTLNDGRNELWQWDTGRKLSVDADCTQVHFSNKVFGRSIDVDVVDGIAIIPDILLQTDKDLTALAFVGTAENGYTKVSKVFKVNKRNKPADYVFTVQDQTTLNEILHRIEDLENRPSGDVSEEDIQNAVNDYLDRNPVSVEEKDPTVPAWAKQPNKPTYTAAEVGALPANTVIPDGGIPIPNTASVGQAVVVKAVDENGKPTEWEAADLPSGGSNELRHIATITLEEDTQLVYLDKDSDGNPFSLSEFGINLYSVGAASNTTEGYFKVLINTPTYNAGLVAIDIGSTIRKDGSTQSRIIKTTGGHYLHSITAAEDNKNSFDENMRLIGKLGNNSTPIFIKNSYGFGADKITSLLFGSDSASTLLGGGTKIAIWGC